MSLPFLTGESIVLYCSEPVQNAPVCTFGSTVKNRQLTGFDHYGYVYTVHVLDTKVQLASTCRRVLRDGLYSVLVAESECGSES